MIIHTPTRVIECHRAIKGDVYFNCLNEDGEYIDCENFIDDWSLYSIEGGEWEREEPTEEEKTQAKIDYLSMMMEVDFDE